MAFTLTLRGPQGDPTLTTQDYTHLNNKRQLN